MNRIGRLPPRISPCRLAPRISPYIKRYIRYSPCKRWLSSSPPTLTLSNGVEIPMVGFGTAFFQKSPNGPTIRRPELAYQSVRRALDLGYRHIDTAYMYGCEPQIGAVLAQEFMKPGGLQREEIFITTKSGHPPVQDFPNAQTQWLYDPKLSAYDGVLEEFHTSLKDLGVGYVDLLLLHWPGMFNSPSRFSKDLVYTPPDVELARAKRSDMWRACEDLHEKGLVRSIGVSNFLEHHLRPLMAQCRVRPQMNQLEIHPYMQQTALVDFCQSSSIAVTAYCPLGSGVLNVLNEPVVVELADSYRISPGQLVLTWLLQRDILVIPKSSNLDRLRANLQIGRIELSGADMTRLASLERGVRVCDDSSSIP